MTKDRKPGTGMGPHIPTQITRSLVAHLKASGLTNQYVADELGVSRDTLQVHYKDEIENSKTLVKSLMEANLIRQGLKNDFRAVRPIEYYLNTQAGWKETKVVEQVGKDGGPIEHDLGRNSDEIRAWIARVTGTPGDSIPSPEGSGTEGTSRGKLN